MSLPPTSRPRGSWRGSLLVGAVGAGMAAAAVVARYQARRQVAPAGNNGAAPEGEVAPGEPPAATPLAPPGAPVAQSQPGPPGVPGPPGSPGASSGSGSGPGAPPGAGPGGLAGWSTAAGRAPFPSSGPTAPPVSARVAFVDVAPAPRPSDRTEDAADAGRPPLPTRVPQAQAPIPSDEPIAYEPPALDVAEIAPLAELARTSWGEAPEAGAGPANGRAVAAPPTTPLDPPPPGPPSGAGAGPRRWIVVGGAAAAALAVVAGVAVATGGGGDQPDEAAQSTSTTEARVSTTTTSAPSVPADPTEAFRQAGLRLTEAGSFTYSGSARTLDVTPVRPTNWLGTEVLVSGEVDLDAGRLHEVAVTEDGDATETVIDGGTVWGRSAGSVEALADVDFRVIVELTHEEPTPQGAQLLPVWLALAAGPVAAPEAEGRPVFAATLPAESLGDTSGATPNAVVTITLDDGGVPIRVEVVGVPDGNSLRLAYDIANVGEAPPIASPADAAPVDTGTTDTTGAP